MEIDAMDEVKFSDVLVRGRVRVPFDLLDFFDELAVVGSVWNGNERIKFSE